MDNRIHLDTLWEYRYIMRLQFIVESLQYPWSHPQIHEFYIVDSNWDGILIYDMWSWLWQLWWTHQNPDGLFGKSIRTHLNRRPLKSRLLLCILRQILRLRRILLDVEQAAAATVSWWFPAGCRYCRYGLPTKSFTNQLKPSIFIFIFLGGGMSFWPIPNINLMSVKKLTRFWKSWRFFSLNGHGKDTKRPCFCRKMNHFLGWFQSGSWMLLWIHFLICLERFFRAMTPQNCWVISFSQDVNGGGPHRAVSQSPRQ